MIQDKKIFNKTYGEILTVISTTLLCLIPAALVSGPFLPDLFLSTIVLIFIFKSFQEKLWHYYNHTFFKVFIFFSFYLIVRSILAENYKLSLESSLFYFRFGFFALAVWHLLDSDEMLLKKFFFSLSIIIFIVLIDAYVQFFSGQNFFGISYDQFSVRLSGVFGDELVLGSFLSRLMPLLIALSISFMSKSLKLISLSILFLIAADVLIFLSGERLAFFILIMSIVIIVFFAKEFKKVRLAALGLTILLVTAISLSNENIRTRMFDSTINSLGLQNKDYKMFSWEHQRHYLSAYKMFSDNIVFGQGPKMFRELCDKPQYSKFDYGCSSHPHSTYMQILAETGLVGLSIILFFTIYVFYTLLLQMKSLLFNKLPHRTDYQICLLSCFFVTLWPLAPSGNFFNNWLSIIYYLPVGFYLQDIAKNNNKK